MHYEWTSKGRPRTLDPMHSRGDLRGGLVAPKKKHLKLTRARRGLGSILLPVIALAACSATAPSAAPSDARPAESAAPTTSQGEPEVRTLVGVVNDTSVKVTGAFLRFDPLRGSAWAYVHVLNITNDNLMRDLFSPGTATIVLIAGSATVRTVSPLKLEELPQTQAPRGSIWYGAEVPGLDHQLFTTITGLGLSLGAALTHESAKFKLLDSMKGVTALTAIRAPDGGVTVTFHFTGSVELSGGISLPMFWTGLVLDPAGVPLGEVQLSLGTGTYTDAAVTATAVLPPGPIGSVQLFK
jgi:hypothetical protein